jgi:uncharacterized protein YecE (DUF72 family)
MAETRIGTSGWHYASWRGPFFPEKLRLKDQLRFYATQFATTELNGVFYRTPTQEAVQGWRAQTPADFVFAWKASKFITHWKRLTEHCENSLELMESRLVLLGEKAGPVLFQLPPQFERNEERLAAFLKMLNPKRRYAFEFRHPSWYAPRVLRLLSDENMSLCISDHADAPAPWKRTADFVYIRGHGPGGRYRGHYKRTALAACCKRIKGWRARGCDVYVYFDNDQKSAAPLDAARLRELVAAATGHGARSRFSFRIMSLPTSTGSSDGEKQKKILRGHVTWEASLRSDHFGRHHDGFCERTRRMIASSAARACASSASVAVRSNSTPGASTDPTVPEIGITANWRSKSCSDTNSKAHSGTARGISALAASLIIALDMPASGGASSTSMVDLTCFFAVMPRG